MITNETNIRLLTIWWCVQSVDSTNKYIKYKKIVANLLLTSDRP